MHLPDGSIAIAQIQAFPAGTGFGGVAEAGSGVGIVGEEHPTSVKAATMMTTNVLMGPSSRPAVNLSTAFVSSASGAARAPG
jgi:hypothetical protein